MASTTQFTWGPANVDSLLTTTRAIVLQARDLLNDAIFTAIPVLRWLQERAAVSKQGGSNILVPLLYGKNSTFKAYEKDDILDPTGQEGLTMASYRWRNYGGTITIFGDELRMNAGEKIIDLLKAKIMQAMASGRDALAIDLFAATQGAKKISALPVLVDAASTVADVNSATNSWWQAIVTASGSFPARGLADLRSTRDQIMDNAQAGAPAPDFLATTRLIYELYEAGLVAGLRYESRQVGDASFQALKWSAAEVHHDPNIATGELYMLSSDALEFVYHRDANWAVGDFKEPVDRDTRTAKVIWMGNLVAKNRRRLGKLTGITA